MRTRKRSAGFPWASLVALVLCSLWVSGAQAQAPQVYMMDTVAQGSGSASLVSDRIHNALVDRLGGSSKIEILKKYEPGKGNAQPANAALDDASKLYNSGIGLLVTDDFEGAARAFQRSVELFEQNLADLQDYAILKDALLRHGIANFKAGYDLDARAALKIWVTLNPGVELSKKDYPEDVIDIVAKERRRAKKRGVGRVKVSSTPAGAEVWMDGVSVGQTPVDLKDVAPGVHYLVVKGKGPFPDARKINVRGKKKVEELVINLESASAAASNQDGPVFMSVLLEKLRKGEIDQDLTPYLQELASRSGADSVIFTVLRKDKDGYRTTGFVYSASEQHMATVEDEVFDADLASLTLNAHQLSQKFIAAIITFPKDRVVTVNPLLVVAAPVKVKNPEEPKKGGGTLVVVPTPELKDVTPGGSVGPGDVVGIGDIGVDGPYDPRKDGDEAGWAKSWWFWTGVGVLVASSAAGSYILLSGDDAEADTKGFSASVTW